MIYLFNYKNDYGYFYMFLYNGFLEVCLLLHVYNFSADYCILDNQLGGSSVRSACATQCIPIKTKSQQWDWLP